MFSNMVKEAVNRLALKYTMDKQGIGHNHPNEFNTYMQQKLGPMANFFIGDLFLIGFEPIYEFVSFFCMADYIQKQTSKSTSILNYVEGHYQEDKPNESIPVELQEANKRNVYERKLEHYHTLNAEKKLEYEMILEQERQDRERKQSDHETTLGNAKRYQGNRLFEFQFNEFHILDAIKEGVQESVHANKTYKRIVSDQGYLHLMNFKEYQDYVGVLEKEIDESDESNELYKNIRYYKLERRLHFELLKSVLKTMKRCEDNPELNENEYLHDLCWLFRLPLLKARQGYSEIYPTLKNKRSRQEWREEVFNLIAFLQMAVLMVQSTLAGKETEIFTDQDWEKFHTTYRPECFKNDYKQRKDYSAHHFTKLMQTLDEHNKTVIEQVKNKIR